MNPFALSLLKIDCARLRDWQHASADQAHLDRKDEIFGNDTRVRLSRDCQEIRRIPGSVEEGEKESISGVENNRRRRRVPRGTERFQRFRVREGAGGCLLLLSGAFAFPRVQCVSPPEENPRTPRISARR